MAPVSPPPAAEEDEDPRYPALAAAGPRVVTSGTTVLTGPTLTVKC